MDKGQTDILPGPSWLLGQAAQRSAVLVSFPADRELGAGRDLGAGPPPRRLFRGLKAGAGLSESGGPD